MVAQKVIESSKTLNNLKCLNNAKLWLMHEKSTALGLLILIPCIDSFRQVTQVSASYTKWAELDLEGQTGGLGA